MATDNNNRKWAWEQLSKYSNCGTYDEFTEAMNDAGNREWAYNELTKRNYNVGKQKDFDDAILDAKDPNTEDKRRAIAAGLPVASYMISDAEVEADPLARNRAAAAWKSWADSVRDSGKDPDAVYEARLRADEANEPRVPVTGGTRMGEMVGDLLYKYREDGEAMPQQTEQDGNKVWDVSGIVNAEKAKQEQANQEREQLLESAYGILGNYWSGAWKPGGDKQIMSAPEKYPTWKEFRDAMDDPEKAKQASDVLSAYYDELNAQAQRNRVQVPFKAKEGDLYDTIGNIQSMLQYKKYYDMDDRQKQFVIATQGYGKREMFDKKGNKIGYAYKLSDKEYDNWWIDEKGNIFEQKPESRTQTLAHYMADPNNMKTLDTLWDKGGEQAVYEYLAKDSKYQWNDISDVNVAFNSWMQKSDRFKIVAEDYIKKADEEIAKADEASAQAAINAVANMPTAARGYNNAAELGFMYSAYSQKNKEQDAEAKQMVATWNQLKNEKLKHSTPEQIELWRQQYEQQYMMHLAEKGWSSNQINYILGFWKDNFVVDALDNYSKTEYQRQIKQLIAETDPNRNIATSSLRGGLSFLTEMPLYNVFGKAAGYATRFMGNQAMRFMSSRYGAKALQTIGLLPRNTAIEQDLVRALIKQGKSADVAKQLARVTIQSDLEGSNVWKYGVVTMLSGTGMAGTFGGAELVKGTVESLSEEKDLATSFENGVKMGVMSALGGFAGGSMKVIPLNLLGSSSRAWANYLAAPMSFGTEVLGMSGVDTMMQGGDFVENYFNTMATLGVFHLPGMAKSALTRRWTDSDVSNAILQENARRKVAGMPELTAAEERGIRERYIDPATGQYNINNIAAMTDDGSLLENMYRNVRQNMREKTVAKNFAQTMRFTDTDRELLQNSPEVAKLLSEVYNRCNDVTKARLDGADKAKINDLIGKVAELAQQHDIYPQQFINKLIYRISGQSFVSNNVSNVTIDPLYDSETDQTRYAMVATDMSGKVIDRQICDTKAEAEKFAEEYKFQLDANSIRNNAGTITTKDVNDHINEWVQRDYEKVKSLSQSKSSSEMTDFELSLLKFVENGDADAMQVVLAHYYNESDAVQKVKERIAEENGYIPEQLDAAVGGHTLEEASQMDAKPINIGGGRWRTRAEQQMVDAYKEGVKMESDRIRRGEEPTASSTTTDTVDIPTPDYTKKETIKNEIASIIGMQSSDAPETYQNAVDELMAKQTLTENGIDIDDTQKLMEIAGSKYYDPAIREAAQNYLNCKTVSAGMEEAVNEHVEKAVEDERTRLQTIEAHRQDGTAMGSTIAFTTKDGQKTGHIVKGHPDEEGVEYVTVLLEGESEPQMMKVSDINAETLSETGIEEQLDLYKTRVNNEAFEKAIAASNGGALIPGVEITTVDGKKIKVIETNEMTHEVLVDIDGKQQTMKDADVVNERMKYDIAQMQQQKAAQQQGEIVKADAEQKRQEEIDNTPVKPSDVTKPGEVIVLTDEQGNEIAYEVMQIDDQYDNVFLKADKGNYRSMKAADLKAEIDNSKVRESLKKGYLIDLPDGNGDVKTWEVFTVSKDNITLRNEDGKFMGMSPKDYQNAVRESLGMKTVDESTGYKVEERKQAEEKTQEQEVQDSFETSELDAAIRNAEEQKRITGRDESGKLVRIPMEIKPTDVKDVYDLLKASGDDPVKVAFDEIAELEKQMDALQQKSAEGATAQERFEARQANAAEIKKLWDQRNMWRLVVNEKGNEQLADKNFVGLVENEYSNDFREKAPEWADYYEKIAKMFNTRIVLVPKRYKTENGEVTNEEVNGECNFKDNCIYLNVDAYIGDAKTYDITPDKQVVTALDYLNAVFGHELTHRIFKGNNSAAAKTFVNAVIKYVGRERFAELCKQDGKDAEEVCCDMAGQLMPDKKFVESLLVDSSADAQGTEPRTLEKRKSFFESMKQTWNDFVNKLQGINAAIPEKTENVEQHKTAFEELQQSFKAAFDAAERKIEGKHANDTTSWIKQQAQEEMRKQMEAEKMRKQMDQRQKNFDKRINEAREELKDDPDALEVLERRDPEDIYEAVADNLLPHSLILKDYVDPDSGRKILGLEGELGLKYGDLNRLSRFIGKRENGARTVRDAAERMWADLPENIKSQWSSVDAANALMELLSSAQSADDIIHYIDNKRIDEARELHEYNLAQQAEWENEANYGVDGADYKQYSVRDAKVLKELEDGEKFTVYRSMQLIEQDGKRYLVPPMAGKVDGKWQEGVEVLADGTCVPTWLESVERPEKAHFGVPSATGKSKKYVRVDDCKQDENGEWLYKNFTTGEWVPVPYDKKKNAAPQPVFWLDKGNGKGCWAAYNPYWHTSTTMLNDQFKEAQDRPNLVTVECVIPMSEAIGGDDAYRAQYAKDHVGKHEWKAGDIQGQLSGMREVYLSRYCQPVSVVPESVVADNIVKQLDGKVPVLPTNVVPPATRVELEKRGIHFVKTDNKTILQEGKYAGDHYLWRYGENAEKLRKKKFREKKWEFVPMTEEERAELYKFSARENAATDKDLDDVASEYDKITDLIGKMDADNPVDEATLNSNMRKLAEMKKEIGADKVETFANETPGVRFSVRANMEGAGLVASMTDADGNSRPMTDAEGNMMVKLNGKEFTGKNPLTVDDIKAADNSILNYMMKDAVERFKTVTPEKAEQIYQKYTDLMNFYLTLGMKENGGASNVTDKWQWLGETVFRSVAKNGDSQYLKSIDITRICKKNEAVINAISELQSRLRYGVTPAQILDLYGSTVDEGYQAPCPVCYVFTRYIRNGKLSSAAINGMKKYGSHLPGQPEEWTAKQWENELNRLEAVKAQYSNDLAKVNDIVVRVPDQIDALAKKITDSRTPEKEKKQLRKQVEELDQQYRKALDVFSQQCLTQWIKTFAIESKNSKWVIRKDAKLPENMEDFENHALDLRLTGSGMIKYPAIQRLRKSLGSAGGKEITQASNNELGMITQLLGAANPETGRNYYLEATKARTEKSRAKLLKSASDTFGKAVLYARQQTLRGGQRQWSWSDNIERLANDVAINLMQMDMLGGAVQTYSKQLEGINLVARMGAYVNGSLMGKGIGYKEVRPEDVQTLDNGMTIVKDGGFDVTDKHGNKKTLHSQAYYDEASGQYYTLEFDDVVGIDAFGKPAKDGHHLKGLFDLNNQLDKAGNILVGMNDIHCKAAMADKRVFFIIPWHASGANSHVLAQMYEYLGSKYDTSLNIDYTEMQEDKNMCKPSEGMLPKVNDRLKYIWENVCKNETDFKCGIPGGVDSSAPIGHVTPSQLKYRAVRDAILIGIPREETYKTKKGETKTRIKYDKVETNPEYMDIINGDEFLKQVYDKVNKFTEGKGMTKDDCNHIYPYEYWDEASTFDTAGINGKRYLEYCRRMGVKPKFCGKIDATNEADAKKGYFIEDDGYWKTLIDRRMYDCDGKFQDLTPVNMEGFEPKLIDPAETAKEFEVTKVADDEGTKRIVDRTMQKENDRTGSIPMVDYDLDMKKAVERFNSNRAKATEGIVYDGEQKLSTRIEQSDPFYSNAAKAVEGIKQEKATPEQWLKMIEKAGGLKKEEDKWMGLSDWLKKQQAMAVVGERGKTVTRQEVEQFIAENSVKVEEVKYDESVPEMPSDVIVPDEVRSDLLDKALESTLMQYGIPYNLVEVDGRDILANMEDYDEIARIYSEKTGKQYDAEDPDDVAFVAEECLRKMEADYDFNSMDYINDWQEDEYMRITKDKKRINGTRLNYTTEGLTNKREIALTVPGIEPYNEGDQIHFGDAGEGRAVAWLRFGDAVDGDGKKVLVVDEIQSKRHQDGRDIGYNDSDEYTISEFENKYGLQKAVFFDSKGEKAGVVIMDTRTKKYYATSDGKTTNLYNTPEEAVSQFNTTRVPDAPFRSNWHELAIKRALRYAAEKGYDKVAWTTGQQQAERYGLSKVLDTVTKDSYDTDDVQTLFRLDFKNEQQEYVTVDNATGKVIKGLGEGNLLSDVVGKDMASKMMEMPEDKTQSIGKFEVGGEGMKGFYDNMLVKYMSKYGKKWGAKVGEVELDLPNEADRVMHAVDVTPEMKESVMGGQPMFSVRDTEPAGDIHTDNFKKWFGDWENDPEHASKVVDEKGEPMVVYHGSPKAGFTEFSTKDGAIWVSAAQSHAKRYGKFNESREGLYEDNTYPLYADIKNPINVGYVDKPCVESDEFYNLCETFGMSPEEMMDKCDVWEWKGNIAYETRLGGHESHEDAVDAALLSTPLYALTRSKGFMELAKEKGYDGISAREHNKADGTTADTWAAFEGTQIKSATDNNGDYDPNNPDIRYSNRKRPWSNDEYNGMSRKEISKVQLTKAHDILDALKENGLNDFKVSHSVTPFGTSTYIQGMYGIKMRISDHGISNINRVWGEEPVALSTPVDNIINMVNRTKKEIDDRVASAITEERKAEGRRTSLDEEWENLKTDFDGMVFKKNNRTTQDLETFRTSGRYPREHIMQTELDKKHGNQYYAYEWAEPKTETKAWDRPQGGSEKPSYDYIEAYSNAKFSTRGNDEARKQMVTEIRHMMDDKRISAMQKSDLNKLLNRVNYATEDNILDQIAKARSVMRDIDTKVLGKQLADIMNLKIQDRNGRNMSIAKNVDNTTRLILGQIKKQMYGLTNSEAAERMHTLRSQNWHLRDDNRFMQGAMEKGLYGQEGDPQYEEKKAMIEANNAQIEANKAEINALEAERREFVAEALEVGSGDVEKDLADLTKKMIDACEPDSNVEFTEEDKAMLTSLELLQQRIAIEKLDQELSDWQKKHADSESSVERKAIEDVIEQVKQQRYDALKNLVSDIQDVVENGKDALRRRNAEEITHRQELIVNMLGDIRGGKRMPADPEKVKERSKQNWFESLFASGLKSFEYMAHAIDVNHFSRDGWFYNYFVKGKNGVMAAESTYLSNYEQSMKTLRDKTVEIFGKNADKIAEDGRKTTTEHGITMIVEQPDGSIIRIPAHSIFRPEETVPLSKNQATYLYMVWQMGDGRAKMEAQGFDEQSINEIKDFIGEDMIKWADYVQDEYLPSLFPKYNKKYLEIYGTPMSDIEHYVPLKIDQTQTQKESDLQDNKVQKGGMQKKNSFQINRTMNLKPIDLTTDCFQVIQQHVKESEEFNAYATVRKDLDALFSSNAVLNQLNANHRGYAKDLQDAARIAVHSDVPEDVNIIEKALVKATKGIIGGNIAFRIGTALKQTLSAPVFYGYTSDPVFMAYLTKSLAKNFTTNVGGVLGGIFAKDTLIKRAEAGKMSGFNDDFRWALENVPSFKNRVSTGDMGMDILNTDMGMMDKYLSKGMAANQLIDAVTCVSGIKAIYEYEMHRMKPMVESGEMTAEEAHNEAVMEADIFYNGTQQSSHRAFMAPIQTSQHAFQKAVTAYQNASMGFARKTSESAVNMMKAAQRQKMIDSYKRTYMLTGIDEAEAEKMAKKQYGKRLRKSLVQLGMFGFMANFLWDLGGRGLFGLFQDDEQKEAAWAWQNIPSYALRGVPGMNIINGLTQGNLKSPFLLYEELRDDKDQIQKLAAKYGTMSPQLAEYMVQKALRIPGIDLEVMANMYLGAEEMVRAMGGEGSYPLAFELMINLAKTNRKSTIKMMYKDAPIDEHLRYYLRAGKVFDGTDWRRFLPGAKELDEKRYKAMMEELAKVRVKEDDAPMTDKERNEVIKSLSSEDALKEAYENTTDSILREKIMNKAKRLEKEGSEFDFGTATWKERLDHYEGKDEKKDKKQPKTDAAKAKVYFNSIAGYDVRREEQKISKYMSDMKEKVDEYKASSNLTDEEKRYVDRYYKIKRILSAYDKKKTELIQSGSNHNEILNELEMMRGEIQELME